MGKQKIFAVDHIYFKKLQEQHAKIIYKSELKIWTLTLSHQLETFHRDIIRNIKMKVKLNMKLKLKIP